MTDLLEAEAIGLVATLAAWAWWAWHKRIRRHAVQHQRETDLQTCWDIWDASIDA